MLSKVIKEDLENLYENFSEQLKSLGGKTILVTGGNGFMPSYLIDLFSYNNSQISNPSKIIVINKNKVDENSRLSHLLENKYVTFLEMDVGKPFDVPKGTDIIIHGASRANPKSFLENPLDTIDANVNGIRTLLDYARANPVENFMFFSSAEIYGNPVKEFIPTPETYPGNVDCTHPMASYIESKRLAETLSTTFFNKFNVPTKNLRILLTYGPGMRNDGKVISDFFSFIKEKNEITLKDDGLSRRCFCYISDSIDGILRVMFNGKSGEAYNIGNDKEITSIKNLAYKVADALGNENSKIIPNPNFIVKQSYGESTRYPDLTKLRGLGFEPKVSLENGLLRLKEHVDEVGWGK